MERGLYDNGLRSRVRCPLCHRSVGDGVVRHHQAFSGPVWQFHCHCCERSFFLRFTTEEIAEHMYRQGGGRNVLWRHEN